MAQKSLCSKNNGSTWVDYFFDEIDKQINLYEQITLNTPNWAEKKSNCIKEIKKLIIKYYEWQNDN